jgi:hypothetical protein
MIIAPYNKNAPGADFLAKMPETSVCRSKIPAYPMAYPAAKLYQNPVYP